MGTGIGKECERCADQLDYEIGFELKDEGYEHDFCKKCAAIVKFDARYRPITFD